MWDAVTALAALDIAEAPFEDLRGNVLGYAAGRSIAISPLNPYKHKTRFHELAHVVLGHTAGHDVVGADILRMHQSRRLHDFFQGMQRAAVKVAHPARLYPAPPAPAGAAGLGW